MKKIHEAVKELILSLEDGKIDQEEFVKIVKILMS
jgi:hypothetical protein